MKSHDTFALQVDRAHLLAASILVAALVVILPSQVHAMSELSSEERHAETTAETFAGYCKQFVGEYATNDRAIAVRNDLGRRGINAWIETHGSYLSGTRTYVVYAQVRC